MRRSVVALLGEMERHGVRLTEDGRLQAGPQAPPALLLRAHRNRRALLRLVGAGRA